MSNNEITLKIEVCGGNVSNVQQVKTNCGCEGGVSQSETPSPSTSFFINPGAARIITASARYKSAPNCPASASIRVLGYAPKSENSLCGVNGGWPNRMVAKIYGSTEAVPVYPVNPVPPGLATQANIDPYDGFYQFPTLQSPCCAGSPSMPYPGDRTVAVWAVWDECPPGSGTAQYLRFLYTVSLDCSLLAEQDILVE
jgi:hypothetical protein